LLLGTGTPNAEVERSGPATAIVVDGEAYLVDCGPGVVRRMQAAKERGLEALAPERLRHVFLTHLHSDHTVGLPDLVYTPWVLEREHALQVHGPPGTARMVELVQQAWSEDVRLRLDGLEPATPDGWRAHVHEVEPGLVFADERVRVLAIPVEHGSWRHAFGYRFETADRVVVVSGDARPSPALIEAARGCDVLVHEVYSAERWLTRPEVWQRYHAEFHTSTLELAAIANEARPGLLVLTHQLSWGAEPADLVREITRLYDGPVAFGNDLDVY
jgi:ribonuclease BN (tRNA processing enzyme)